MQSAHNALAWSVECRGGGGGVQRRGEKIIPAGYSKVESGDRKLGGVERTGGSTGEGEIVIERSGSVCDAGLRSVK